MKKDENKNKIEEEFDIKDIYTPLSVAKKEIWKRWNDKELRKKVEDFLGGDIPDVFKDGPKAVLARHIITPNKEYSYFNDLVDLIELNPLGFEYLSDKFFTVNQGKLHLGKIIFLEKEQYISKKIIEFKDSEGKNICELATKWNENLVKFHHKLPKLLNIKEIEKIDASTWYKANGKNAKENYKYFLALFICNGVLFENFFLENGDQSEKEFTKNVLIEAFNDINNHFKIKPIIIPLLSRKLESNSYWYSYPSKVGKIIEKMIK